MGEEVALPGGARSGLALALPVHRRLPHFVFVGGREATEGTGTGVATPAIGSPEALMLHD